MFYHRPGGAEERGEDVHASLTWTPQSRDTFSMPPLLSVFHLFLFCLFLQLHFMSQLQPLCFLKRSHASSWTGNRSGTRPIKESQEGPSPPSYLAAWNLDHSWGHSRLGNRTDLTEEAGFSERSALGFIWKGIRKTSTGLIQIYKVMPVEAPINILPDFYIHHDYPANSYHWFIKSTQLFINILLVWNFPHNIRKYVWLRF